MRTTKKKRVTIDETSKVSCDKCGKVISHKVDPNIVHGVELTLSAGYGSRFDEMYVSSWDICDGCWSDFFDTFKNRNPRMEHY